MLIFSLRLEPYALRHFYMAYGRIGHAKQAPCFFVAQNAYFPQPANLDLPLLLISALIFRQDKQDLLDFIFPIFQMKMGKTYPLMVWV